MASLGRATAKVGGHTLTSRILGFIRDLVIARIFGADAATDAFFVAMRIPNTARRLFAEGAFSLTLVPMLGEIRRERGDVALKPYLDHLSGTLGAALLLVTMLAILAAPALVWMFAPGFGERPGQSELTIELLRLTLPYVLFISLTALAGGVLNTFERFGVPAFTPALLNIVLIGCAIWLAPLLERPIFALAFGVLIGGVVQLGFQLPFLARVGLLPRPRLAPADPLVRRTFRRMAPALLGASVGQINLLAATILASFLASGSISWLYYADRLLEFPVGILGTALGIVILPRLSERHGASDPAAFSATIDWALRLVVLTGVPAAIGLAVLSGPIIATLFHSSGAGEDAFTAIDVRRTAAALAAYSAGLVGLIAVKVLAPGYYARHRVREPLRIAMIAILVNLGTALALIGPLGHVGLAAATAISALANAALLLWGLLRDGSYRPAPGWGALALRALTANLGMLALLWTWSGGLDAWLASGGADRLLHLAALIPAAALLYGLLLLLSGLRPRDLLDPPGASGR